jgi:hypothetical protein
MGKIWIIKIKSWIEDLNRQGHFLSTDRRQTGMLVDVHSERSSKTVVW